uniref:Uncharacterized protein n=1 Tax=Arundo donax TaxID=35708 RepID=A0A0A9HH37_ARUDO
MRIRLRTCLWPPPTTSPELPPDLT